MRLLASSIPLLFASVVLIGCHTAIGATHSVPASQATYAPQKPGSVAANLSPMAILADKFRSSSRTRINIVQLGDSHTAADLFTGEMRRLLQARYGDGGIGFVAATPVPGTRYDDIVLTAAAGQWTLISSRNELSQQFPLGGYLSLPTVPGATIHIAAREPSAQRYRISVLYQATLDSRLSMRSNANAGSRALAATAGQWTFSPAFDNVVLPLDMTVADNHGLALGGWNIQSMKDAGVSYSALGINGGRLDGIDKWQSDWPDMLEALHPDMVILAYGTNEAFDDTLDLELYQAQLTEKLALLRRTLPNAVILLVGPPDSIKRRGVYACTASQPRFLHDIVQIQRHVAQQFHALFWDWQGFMGGVCSIARWQSQELARDDLVHLTKDGYRKSADGLYDFLRQQLARADQASGP